MAWVEKTPKDKGHAWRVGYRGPDRRQRYKTFTRKADADLFAATVETDMSRGDWTDPHLGRITVTEWAYQVEASRLNRRPSTIVRDDSYLRNLILPTFADHTLIQVQPVAVQQWVAKLNTAGYAAATIRKAYELLARIFTAAVDSGLIARTPCRGVKLPKIEQSDKRYLTPTEIQQLADVIDPRFQALVLTAAYSGARYRGARRSRSRALRTAQTSNPHRTQPHRSLRTPRLSERPRPAQPDAPSPSQRGSSTSSPNTSPPTPATMA